MCKKCSLSPFSNVDTSFFNNRQLLYSLIRTIRMAMPTKVHSESDLKSQLHSNWKQLLSWCARVVHLRRLQVNGSLLLPYLREKSPYCNQIVTYKCKSISYSDYFSIKKNHIRAHASFSSWAELFEAWLALRRVKYHGNLLVLILLNLGLALTLLRTTRPWGLLLKSPETFRANFGCHNSLNIFTVLLVFLTLKPC